MSRAGRGHGPFYPLGMAVPLVQPGVVILGSKRGSEATEQGRVHSRIVCENSCMKTAFSCTLNANVRR